MEIIELIIEFMQEEKFKCLHCGFVGDNKWFVDGYENCVECCEFIQGNGLEFE